MYKKRRKEKQLSIVGLALYVCVFIMLSIVILFKGFAMVKKTQVTYVSNSDVNYEVYLKENNHYSTDHLGPNDVDAYIASLIDRIQITFMYNLNSGESMNGETNYKITGTLYIKEQNKDTNLDIKYYDLTPVKKEVIKNNSEVTINTFIDVDYDYYNDIINKYKKEWGVPVDATLVVKLDVDTKLEPKYNILKSSSLTIPLSEQTVHINIEKQNNDEDSNIYTYIEKPVLHYTLIGCGLLFLLFYGYTGTEVAFKIVKKIKSKSKYDVLLKKIFSDYDQIIVNSDTFVDTTGVQTVDVTKFEELVDAQMEVHKPIIYFEDDEERKAYFTIIDNETAYRYIVDGNKLDRKKN